MQTASEIAQRTERKVRRRLIPYLMLVYLLAYLDRVNLSVAKSPMQGELGFDEGTFGLGAGIFFIGYLFLEIPGTLIVERWSARRWIARIMISWGAIAALTGFLGTALFGAIPLHTQFYGMRFLLGAAEAGFFPGVIVYFSHWFRLQDRTRAKAFFMVTQPLSLLVGVPVSRWILNTIHWQGLAGWRWLFVLEGLPSVVLGMVTVYYLTDRPQGASWLEEDEREWLASELEAERMAKVEGGRVTVGSALRRKETWLLVAIYFLIVGANQGFIFFFPSLVEGFPELSNATRTSVMTWPYFFGVFGILLFGLSAYRRGEYTWHTAVPMIVNGFAIGLVAVFQNDTALAIGFLCLVGLTLQAYLPAFWTWPTAYLGQSAAAVAVGTINSVGNLGGFTGTYLFGRLRDKTGSYQVGLWTLAACTVAAAGLSLLLQKPRAENR